MILLKAKKGYAKNYSDYAKSKDGYAKNYIDYAKIEIRWMGLRRKNRS